MNTSLVNTLKIETQSLREQYLKMTSEWAVEDFNSLVQFANDYRAGKFGFNNGHSKKYYRLPRHIVNPTYGSLDFHVDLAITLAEKHYQNSIEKLATRIEKKGLDQSAIRVATSHIGVNIETTLTDGKKTVRAFTIIASGMVQRPHYRYLVK